MVQYSLRCFGEAVECFLRVFIRHSVLYDVPWFPRFFALFSRSSGSRPCNRSKKTKKHRKGAFGGASSTKVEPIFYNHGTAVYIIKTEFCISPTQSVAYHHCEREYSLRLMIYTFGDDILAKADDIPLLSQWIKKDEPKFVFFWSGLRVPVACA